MLFDSLDKLKRNSILSAILLMALGAIMLVCPPNYVDLHAQVAGYTSIVIAMIAMAGILVSIALAIYGLGKLMKKKKKREFCK